MGKKKSSNVTIVEKSRKVIDVEYQLLVSERDDLLEAEIGYKRRIEKLEKESAETLRSFDILYNENKILRSKLDTPEGAGADSVESYNDVYKDREHLREANRAFKRRIRQLEDDIGEEQKKFNVLYSSHQLVTQKAQLETEFATRSRDEKIDDLEKEHDELDEKVKLFLKEREQYEYRIAEMDKERNELQDKHDMLADQKHEFQLRCDVLQEDREKLKQKIADLEDKVPDPEQKAKEEQQYLTMQAQVVALQVVNTDASKTIHSLKEEIRVLNKLKKENVEMVDRALSVIVDKDVQKAEMMDKERLDNTVLELEEIKKRSVYVLKENDKLKSETADLESKIANQDLLIEELKSELDLKKIETEEMAVVVRGGENLNEEYLALQEKLKDKAALTHALENELVQEKKMAKLKLLELNKDLEQTKDKLNTTDKQRMKLESEYQKTQTENSTLEKVTEAQALELRNMKAQLEQIQSMFEEKTNKYDEMKKTEKESQQELRESRIDLHVVKHELDNLRMEKAGHFNTLKSEMEVAKTERKEESEQMRNETARLREEVKKLKDYEHKITTMDSEIRRLMNRLRMSENFKRMAKKPPKGDLDNDGVKELRKRQREIEREKYQLLQEKRQWEILRTKYHDLQMNNRRLVEENKRVRGDLDGTSFRVDTLEKRFQKINVKTDDVEDPKRIQKAQYVEKPQRRELRMPSKKKSGMYSKYAATKTGALRTITEESAYRHTEAFVGISTKKAIKPLAPKERMTSKKPALPGLNNSTGLQFGKGYRELHSNKYSPTNKLSLL